jgi:serine/threonine protein kinase
LNVKGYSCRYELGKVLGAGSFGIVREAVGKRTGTHFACKTIPKVPKRGKGTPRYLLKLQTEVDAMQQLGPSLDAVYLKVAPGFISLLISGISIPTAPCSGHIACCLLPAQKCAQ